MNSLIYQTFLLMVFSLLTSEAAYAGISFAEGWNSEENSNVRTYTEAEATSYLENFSDDLKTMIDSSACHLVVTKGCHQQTAPHFTVNGSRRDNCKSKYAGTKSTHIPCQK